MGLAIVELIMRVEEAFEIEIGDEEFSELETVGQLHSCIVSKIGWSDSLHIANEQAQVWQKLKAIIGDEMFVEPDKITPEAQFVRDLNLDLAFQKYNRQSNFSWRAAIACNFR